MNLLNNWSIVSGALVAPDGHTFAADEPVSAGQVEECLGILAHTTIWFNHDGFVPAQSVVDEAMLRVGGTE